MFDATWLWIGRILPYLFILVYVATWVAALRRSGTVSESSCERRVARLWKYGALIVVAISSGLANAQPTY
jgi:hypothetical protein